MVALTGRSEAYYEDHRGTPQEFVSAAKYGYLFQGQVYAWQKQRRGTPALDLAPGRRSSPSCRTTTRSPTSARGRRFHQLTSPGRARAMTALMLLMPRHADAVPGPGVLGLDALPLLRRPQAGTCRLVRAGPGGLPERSSRASTDPATVGAVPVPDEPATFAACQLDWGECERHAEAVALHRDLLRLRREDPVFAAQAQGRPRRRGARAARPSCCASSARTATTGCSS